METIADLLFEARSLRTLPRSGYQFLGAGSESVAEHSYSITFIAFVLARLVPEADGGRHSPDWERMSALLQCAPILFPCRRPDASPDRHSAHRCQ